MFLVDDDPFSLNLTEQHIRNLGYPDVSVFRTGEDCLEHLDQKPEAIILDHKMNSMSGYEVLKEIKRRDQSIFVVMLSGQENLKVAVDSLKNGAFDYLIKGDDEEAKIEKVLQRIHSIRTLVRSATPSYLNNRPPSA
ncbi:MAG: response regulator [Bacteroidetes bacterium]|nr:response regulator [Bacteroidota bacterium]